MIFGGSRRCRSGQADPVGRLLDTGVVSRRLAPCSFCLAGNSGDAWVGVATISTQGGLGQEQEGQLSGPPGKGHRKTGTSRLTSLMVDIDVE